MPRPDDPMIVNLFVLAFSCLLGWMTVLGIRRYLARGAADAVKYRRPLWGGFAFVLALLVINWLWATASYSSWVRIAKLQPFGSTDALLASADGSPVVLVGSVGSRNKAVRERRAASWANDTWDGPTELIVAVEDGEVPVTELETARAWGWRGSQGSIWLDISDPVVVFGTSGRWRTKGGQVRVNVKAGLVCVGTYASFVEQARRQGERIWPRIVGWGSLAAALGIATLGVAARLHRTKED